MNQKPITPHWESTMKRSIGWWLLVSITSVACAAPALAQYPTRPLRLLVGLQPGGGTDITARTVATRLTDVLGQQVVVENRAGSGGLIAADIAAKSPPDGYTLLLGSISYSAIFASLYKKLPYDPVKDFAPITLLATTPNVLCASLTFPPKSVAEFIAYAKKNPGKVNYASSGNGSSLHLSMEYLKFLTGIDVVHVPYKGGSATISDLIAGQIQIMFNNMPTQVPFIKAGKVRALVVTTAKRNPQFPELPTMIEAGVPGFEVVVWYSVFAPAKVAKPIIAKLNSDIVKVLNMPDIRERLAQQGSDAAPSSPEELAAFQKAEIAKWAKVVKASGATAD
jgi:tripartite-type tricarboxylate transporter receptor subunit TctC